MKHILCPDCHSLNRVDPARLEQAVCGKCRKPLAPASVLHLDGPQLDELMSKDGLPLLVDFWAPWCGPCRMMAPAFEEAAKLLAPQVRLGKLDTEANQALARVSASSPSPPWRSSQAAASWTAFPGPCPPATSSPGSAAAWAEASTPRQPKQRGPSLERPLVSF